MYKNLFYCKHASDIGGVETFYYEIAKKYGKDHDITLLYKTGDQKQLQRLRELIRVVQYTGGTVQCERAFFGYSSDIIENIEAEEYIQIVHADFKTPILAQAGWKPNTHPRFTQYVCVSENNRKSFEELTGKPCEACYNPITPVKPGKVLHLISATRLTGEKGGQRMKSLAETLDAAGVEPIPISKTYEEAVLNRFNSR